MYTIPACVPTMPFRKEAKMNKKKNFIKRLEPYILKAVRDATNNETKNNKAIACRHCGVTNSRDYEQYRCQYCGAPLFDTRAR